MIRNRPRRRTAPVRCALLAALLPAAAGAITVHHDIDLRIDPETGRLEAVDRFHPPPGEQGAALTFYLHERLSPHVIDGARELAPAASPGRLPAPARAWRLRRDRPDRPVVLGYEGRLPREARPSGAGYVDERGVYLNAATVWYPALGRGEWLTVSLRASLPDGWRAVAQGAREPEDGSTARWVERQPQEDIVLVAGRWHRYQRPVRLAGAGREVRAEVYLGTPDAALAQRYLDGAARDLTRYSRLLGTYPYAKFATVENFWESGYGMPSFTLIGARLLRMPFLLDSSFPHEVLHNWWGNGVYVDHATGNWSEGLTAYLADHLVRETQGRGAEYRRAALQKYRNYVDHGRDFPLSAFRWGHDRRYQAVGYNKSLMFFHMLRARIGDAAFVDGLRRFWREQRFRRASFDDLRVALEAASGMPLGAEFDQWVRRTGAPELRLSVDGVAREGNGYRLAATLEQAQPGAPYRLRVPVAVALRGVSDAWTATVEAAARRTAFVLRLPAEPLRVAVDPEFDLFRRLDPAELPPSLGEIFGGERAVAVLPAGASGALRDGYRELAAVLGATTVRLDSEGPPPPDAAAWILGWDNALAPAVLARAGGLEAGALSLGGRVAHREQACAVLVARSAAGGPRGWIGCERRAAFPGLARKLPHYSRYSFLVFEGDAPTNVAKGQWPVRSSPLDLTLSGEPGASPLRLPGRAALAPP